MKKNEILSISKIVFPGKGLARGADGVAVFVEGVLPGETADVFIYKNKKKYKEGRAVEIIEKSDKRINPRCPSFGECGGCTFGHTGYDYQLELKNAYVKESLYGYEDKLEPIVRGDDEWGYRNKMEFSFFEEDSNIFVGLHKKGRFNSFVKIPPCYICDESFSKVIDIVIKFSKKMNYKVYDKKTNLGFLRHLVIRKGKNTNELLVNLVTNIDSSVNKKTFAPLIGSLKGMVTSFYWTENSRVSDAVIPEKLTLFHGKDMIREELNVCGKNFNFSISPFSFFQTNTRATEKLYEKVIEYLEPQKTDQVLDLYCGTGSIGICIASYVKSVLGVENVQSSVENAILNKGLNGIENISFKYSFVEDWIKEEFSNEFNALIVDPPRTGLSQKAIDFINNSKFEKIVYVSCNPPTLARDLKLLNYSPQKITPFDMFPQTYHVECVSLLERV